MPKKALIKPKVPVLTEPEIDEKGLALDSRTLEEQAKAELDPELLTKIKKICYYIAENGLDLEEACMLSDIDYEKFKNILLESDLVQKIINMKSLQYKKGLLYIISQKAREGDDKLALWLLERRYPSEYGSGKKSPQGGDEGDLDIVAEAIEFVQTTGDNTPMVKTTSARGIVIKKGGASREDLAEKLKKMLNGN